MKPLSYIETSLKIPLYFPFVHQWHPLGKLGDVKISTFTINEKESLETLYEYELGEYIPPGKYTKLSINGEVWMTDTPIEQGLNREVLEARGDVLVCGLGMGMILPSLIKKRSVRSITVIEKNLQIIQLTSRGLYQFPLRGKLRIVDRNAYEWKPEGFLEPIKHFDFIWLDIFYTYPTVDAALEDRYKLMERYREFLKPDGVVKCWKLKELEMRKEQK